MSASRHNLAVTIGPPTGGSSLKMRMAIKDLPARKGEALIGSLIGQDGAAPYAYSLVSGSLPPGVSLDAAGNMSGTPTTVGYYQFLAKVQDAALGEFTSRFAIEIVPPFSGVNVTPTPMEEALDYSYTFSVSGNTGTVTWSQVSGTIPSGLSLSSAGVLDGTPDASQVPGGDNSILFNFVVRATDGGSGDTLDVPVSVELFAFLTDISFQTFNSPPLVLTLGTNYTTFPPNMDTAFDAFLRGCPPYTVKSSTLPSGMTINQKSGVISGTPDTIATVADGLSMSVEIIDALGKTISDQIDYIVVAPNQQLQPQKSAVNVGNAGPYKMNFTGSGVDSVSNDGTTVTVTISGGSLDDLHIYLTAQVFGS